MVDLSLLKEQKVKFIRHFVQQKFRLWQLIGQGMKEGLGNNERQQTIPSAADGIEKYVFNYL